MVRDVAEQNDNLDSVEAEKKRVLQNEENGVKVDGIRIVGVQKIYRKLPFGIRSINDMHAVKGIHLDIDKNELFCLLGHNGAVKSTLFNMLTGIISPTFGFAKICGHDIRYDQEKIRKLIGVVP